MLCLEQYDDAIQCCDKALSIDSKNVKVLFRKAKALSNLSKFEESLKILNDLDLKEAKSEIENIKEKMNEEN